MKLRGRNDDTEKLWADRTVIIGETPDCYIAYDMNQHTFETYARTDWTVEDMGAAIGTEIPVRVFALDPLLEK